VQVISDGRAVAALSDWIDLDAIAPRVIINGQPARVATGNSFLQWKVKPMGKWYPPIAFQAQMTLENMRQTVIGYPYVPFVTVAHRWFDTIHVVSQVTFRAGFMRHDYSTGYGWQERYQDEAYPVYNGDVRLSDTQPQFGSTWDYVFVDNLSEGLGGKPGADIRNLSIRIDIKAPDGIVMDTITMPVAQWGWPMSTHYETSRIEEPEVDRWGNKTGGKTIKTVTDRVDTPVDGAPDLGPLTYVKSEKGMFKGRAAIWQYGGNHIHTRLRWEISLEESLKYSRVNNRFYPWFGFVNASRPPAQLDFGAMVEDPLRLGFPYTRFFQLTPAAYKAELQKVVPSPTDPALQSLSTPGGIKVPSVLDTQFSRSYSAPTSNADASGNIGSSYRSYLENEHFELIVVNASDAIEGTYTIKDGNGNLPSERQFLVGTPTQLPAYGQQLKYTVSTAQTKPVMVAWPKSSAITDVRAVNAAGVAAMLAGDSERVYQSNLVLNRSDRAKIDTYFMSPDLDSQGVIRAWSRYLVAISEDQLTEKSPTIPVSGTLAMSSGIADGSGGMKWTIGSANVAAYINNYLPQNVVREGYQIRLSDPMVTVPSGYDAKIQLSFGDNGQLLSSGQVGQIQARISKSSWGTYWDGSLDPILAGSQGWISGTISGFSPPVFGNANGSSMIPISSAYPRVPGRASGLRLWGEDLSVNPDIELGDATVVILDPKGTINRDVMGQWTGSGVALSVVPNQKGDVWIPMVAGRQAQLRPPVRYALSYRQDSGWAPMDGVSGLNSPSILGLWNVSRLNGDYSIRFENKDQNTVAMDSIRVGTRVNPSEYAEVKSAYGRVVLQVPAGTFATEKVLTVTPVKVGDIHIQNMPDISDLGFMPIVEILPETSSSDFKKSVNLMYQYTANEVAQIKAGTYPGLAKGVDLDAVSIYHISTSGKLVPAPTIPAAQRWVDLDHDGVLGSAGDVYRIVAALDHFSIYLPLEGWIPDSPLVAAETQVSRSVTLVGYVEKSLNGNGLDAVVYRDDDPQFVQLDDPSPPQLVPLNSSQIEWLSGATTSYNIRIKSIPLCDGSNYLSLTYGTRNIAVRTIPYATIPVTLDLAPPLLTDLRINGSPISTSNSYGMSPNRDRIADDITIQVTPTESGLGQIWILNSDGKTILDQTVQLVGNQPWAWTWNGATDFRIPSQSVDASVRCPDGRYTIAIFMTDRAGNMSSETRVPVAVDTVAPVIRHLVIPEWLTLSDRIDSWMISPEDQSGLSTVAIGLDGEPSRTVVIPLNGVPSATVTIPPDAQLLNGWSGLQDGRHQVVVVAVDRVGNRVTVTRDIGLDSTPPAVGSLWMNGKSGDKTPRLINASVAAGGVVVTASVRDSRPLTVSLNFVSAGQVVAAIEGRVSGSVAVVDIPPGYGFMESVDSLDLGVTDGLNETHSQMPVRIVVSAPVITTASISNSVFSPARTRPSFRFECSKPVIATMTITASGNQIIDSQVSSGSILNLNWPANRRISDGVYEVTLQFADRAGNRGPTWNGVIEVDQTAPVVTVPIQLVTPNADPSWISQVGATDLHMNTVKIEWFADTATVDPIAFLKTGESSALNYRVTASDGAGNEIRQSGVIIVDRASPIIQLDMARLISSRNTVVVSGRVKDDSGKPVLLTVGYPGSEAIVVADELGVFSYTLTAPIGDSMAMIQALDSVGRRSTAAVLVEVDPIPPVVSIRIPPRLLMESDSDFATVTVVASKPVSTTALMVAGRLVSPPELVSNQATSGDTTVQGTVVLSKATVGGLSGSAEIRWTVRDMAGNSATTTATVGIITVVPKPQVALSKRIGSQESPIVAVIDGSSLVPFMAQYPDLTWRLSVIRYSDIGDQVVATMSVTSGGILTSSWTLPVTLPDSDRYGIQVSVLVGDSVRFQSAWDPTTEFAWSNQVVSFNAITLRSPDTNGRTPIRFDVGTGLVVQMVAAQIGSVLIPVSNSNGRIWDCVIPDSIPDGAQSLALRVTLPSGVSATGNYPIAVDRKAPVLTTMQPTGPFKPFDTADMTVTLSTDEGVTPGIPVVVASGNPVTLVTPRVMRLSDRSVGLIWTGKQTPTQWLGSGVYTVQLPVADRAGNISTANWTINQQTDFPSAWIETSYEAMNPNLGAKSATIHLSRKVESVTLVLVDAQTQQIKRRLIQSQPMSGDITVSFDGKNDMGSNLTDGIYEWVATIKPSATEPEISARRRLTIKTKPPVFYPKLQYSQIRPMVFPLTITNINLDSSWLARIDILDQSSDTVLATLVQKPRYADLSSVSWSDIAAVTGKKWNDGDYRLRIWVSDEASNEATALLPFNLKSTMTGSVTGILDRPYMTPNADGVYDSLSGKISVSGTEVDYMLTTAIHSSAGRKIRTLGSQKVSVFQPFAVNWNGLDDQYLAVDDGGYVVVADLAYLDGTPVQKWSLPFVVVTPLPVVNPVVVTAPISAVGAGPRVSLPLQLSSVLSNGILPEPTVKLTASVAGRTLATDGFQLLSRNTAQLAINPAGLLDGLVPVSVLVEDPVGNRTTIESAITLTVDSTAPLAPVMVLVSPPTTNQTTVVVSGQFDSGTLIPIVNGVSQNMLFVATNSMVTLNSLPFQTTTNELTFAIVDEAGNQSSRSNKIEVNYDTVLPQIVTASVSAQSLAYHQAATLNIGFSEPIMLMPTAAIQLIESGRSIGTFELISSGSCDVRSQVRLNQIGVNGTAVLSITGVTDLAGNPFSNSVIRSIDSLILSIALDSVIPTVSITSVSSRMTSQDYVLLTVSTNKVVQFDVSVNGTISGASGSSLWIPLTATWNVISVRAVDSVGNYSDWTTPIGVTRDSIPLQIHSIRVPERVSGNRAAVQFELSKWPVSSFLVQLNGVEAMVMNATTNLVTIPIPLPANTQGTLDIRIASIEDSVGYRVSLDAQVGFDNRPPSVETIADPVSVSYGPVSTSLLWDESVTVVSVVPSLALSTGSRMILSTVVTPTENQGDFRVKLQVEDRAKNQKILDWVPWTIDTRAPDIATCSMPGWVSTGTYTVRVTANEAIVSASIQIGDAVIPTMIQSNGLGILGTFGVSSRDAQGEFPVTVTMVDSLGNTRVTPLGTIGVDTVAPIVNSVPADGYPTQNIQFDGYFSEDVATVSVSSSMGPVNSVLNGRTISVSVPSLSPDGDYSFQITARDLAGNISQLSSLRWTLDRRTPSMSVGTLPPVIGPGKFLLPVILSEPVSGLSATVGTLNGLVVFQDAGHATIQFNIPATMSQGAMPIRVAGIDAAGNAASQSIGSVQVDTLDPILLSDGVLANGLGPKWELTYRVNETVASASAWMAGISVPVIITGNTLMIRDAGGNTIPDGQASLKLQIVDTAGNTTNQSIGGFVIDSTEPILQLNQTALVPITRGIWTVDLMVSEALAAVSAQFDERSAMLVSSNALNGMYFYRWQVIVDEGTRQGQVSFNVSCTDNAGNRGSAV
ncbi:hypothetical protein EBR57_00855, partial [bacterium]|nr:hypothetical protein [bacterium]